MKVRCIKQASSSKQVSFRKKNNSREQAKNIEHVDATILLRRFGELYSKKYCKDGYAEAACNCEEAKLIIKE